MKEVRIVLVEPIHPGNIGGSARAMKTMGQSDLWVVKPKRFPDPQADWRAAGALDVLDAANVVTSVEQAIAECHWVVGTSTRNRRIPWPIGDAKEIVRDVHELPSESKVAILFGREDNGLTNEELQRCNAHLQIPANPDYASLNLAMAVQLVCYELYQYEYEEAPQKWDRRLASAGEIDGLMSHFEAVLTESGFVSLDNPGQTLTRLRRLFARAQADETEVQILRGMLKHFGQTSAGESGNAE